MDIINQNIRTLRKLENIKSQSEFGERLGVPSHNINKYENNVIPKPEVLRKIATEFKINLHLFLTKTLDESNFEEFKIEHNTEAKLENLVNESKGHFEITRSDLDRVATFFGDKLKKIEEDDCNEIDRMKLFGDIRSIFLAFNKKLKDFYEMQDRLASILGDGSKTNQP
ncbi:MAG: helix-turn-helix transcriptional regulator [Cyclobacteriaceae bacterium]|nr:helix-turn-helix transcriptional regulator [Cyclobacteriaceae bacterium HetDA_MAG_MS6]